MNDTTSMVKQQSSVRRPWEEEIQDTSVEPVEKTQFNGSVEHREKPSSLEVLEAARRYLGRGWGITFLAPGEKNPQGTRAAGWTTRSMTEAEYLPGDNIGIMTGWVSGNKIPGPEQTFLVCMDLERSEVVALADQYLPPTGAIEGRPGNPRSHWLYYVKNVPSEALVTTGAQTQTAAEAVGLSVGPRKRAFRGPDDKVWIEWLASGQQFACPPSLHPSGETRIWHEAGEAATLEYSTLWDALCKLAEALSCTLVGKDKLKSEGGQAASGRRTDRLASQGGRDRPWEKAEGNWYLVPLHERLARVQAYVRTLPQAVEGQHGQNTAYRFCRLVRNDFALSGSPEADRMAWELYLHWNESCAPPWDLSDPDDAFDFKHRFDDALRPDPQYPYGCKLESPSSYHDPFYLAERFNRAYGPWRFWHGGWYQYDGGRYVPVEDTEVRALVQGHIKAVFDEVLARRMAQYKRYLTEPSKKGQKKPTKPQVASATGAIVGYVLDALEAQTLIAGTIEPGNWLSTGQREHLIPVANGLLDLSVPSKAVLREPSASYFTLTGLPYLYDPSVRCDEWERVTRENAGDDETYQLLQEFAGYCLTDHHRAEKGLFLTGTGSNGKTVYLAGLTAMLGGVNCNVSNGQLEMFGQRFATFQTLGKLLNVADDQNEIDLAAEGEWKKFITGGAMTFERKGKDHFSATPTAKLVVGCNKLPYFSDKTDGVWRRVIVVEMNVKHEEGKKDPALKEVTHWEGQRSGLLNWAIQGLARLQAHGWQFTVPSASRDALQLHRDDCNPAGVFLKENFIADPRGSRLSTKTVYVDYRTWMEEHGYTKPLAEPSFNRIVRETFPRVERSPNARRLEAGGRARVWLGLARISPSPDDQSLPFRDRPFPAGVGPIDN